MRLTALLLTAGLTAAAAASHVATLPTHTVSGISAGAFMAVQHHVAFSRAVTGVGAVAGGPFYCSQGLLPVAVTSCMTSPALISVSELITITHTTALSGFIDAPVHLKDDNVWLFSGRKDTVVNSGVVSKALQYYSGLGVKNIVMVNSVEAEHSMPTNFWGNPCGFKGEPYINNCAFDAAGEILLHLLNSSTSPKPIMRPPVSSISSNLVQFPQRPFFSGSNWQDAGLSKDGFAYVPRKCAEMGDRLLGKQQGAGVRIGGSAQCLLHVAYHGCLQSYHKINSSFVNHAGYNEWAEANNIVILYPQARASLVNPKGCWDWWGYTGKAFASNVGVQLSTVRNIVRRVLLE